VLRPYVARKGFKHMFGAFNPVKRWDLLGSYVTSDASLEIRFFMVERF